MNTARYNYYYHNMTRHGLFKYNLRILKRNEPYRSMHLFAREQFAARDIPAEITNAIFVHMHHVNDRTVMCADVFELNLWCLYLMISHIRMISHLSTLSWR